MFSVYESLREGGCKKQTFSGFQFFVNVERRRPEICLCPQASVPSEKLDSCVGRGLYLITYLITLSLEKEIIVLEKCLKKVPNFVSQKLYSKPGI